MTYGYNRGYPTNNGRLKVTTGPASEPVDTADVKEWLRIESDVTEDDTLLDNLISASRSWIEGYIETKLITQTVTQTLDNWPRSREYVDPLPSEGHIDTVLAPERAWVELMGRPVQSITAIYTYDDSGTQSEWSSANYDLSNTGDRARVLPKNGIAWPSATRNYDAIEIVYVVGYGASGSDVPQDILTAMRMMIAHWYENRESVVMGIMPNTLEMGVKSLLSKYKFWSL